MLTILLIEDSLILRDRLRVLIGRIPNVFLLAETDNEADAQFCLKRFLPAVAVIDLQLRGSSGLAVIRHIKDNYVDTTMIVLTNLAQPEYEAKCRELGAHFFFDKSKGTKAFTRLLADMSAAANDGKT
jgi:DNA-binding NarL/FixJ family response regulator